MIHPLVLGQVYRTRSQIQMLARKLIIEQVKDENKIEEIISFLCSESGSHDYTINRREANRLGLRVEKPNDELYNVIKQIYDDIHSEMELSTKYDPNAHLGAKTSAPYIFTRCLLESLAYGSNHYVSEGNLTRKTITVPPGVQQMTIEDQRTFEGWRPIK